MSYELQGFGSYELQGMGGLRGLGAVSAATLPAVPPGMLPGTTATDVELRTKGTIRGVVPRGTTALANVAKWQCINSLLPGGAPAQTSAERSAYLSAAQNACKGANLQAPTLQSTIDPSMLPPQEAAGDNTMLYVGLGVGALVLLGGAYMLMK